MGVLWGGRGRVPWVLAQRVVRVEILGEAPGEDLKKIFSSFPGVSFQGVGLHGLIGRCQAGGHYPMQLVLRSAMGLLV